MSEKKVGYMFRVGYDLGNGRNVDVTGNFAEGATNKEMDLELDKIMKSMERQRTKNEIVLLEANLEVAKDQLSANEKAFHELTEKEKREGKLNSADKQHVNTMKVNIGRIAEDIEKGKAAIKEKKKAVC